MYKIAVCEDDEILCKTIVDYLKVYSEVNSVEFEIDKFYTCEALLESISNSKAYELIVLDIDFAGIGGVEAGKYIREVEGDNTVLILYISYSETFALQLFKNRPLNFLIKPLKEETLKKEIDKALAILADSSRYFSFQSERVFHKIPHKDIIYMESNDKKICMHATNGDTYEFYGKLTQIAQSLPEEYFFLIHKSYLINYLHLSCSDYETVTMNNGAILPISQSNRKDIRLKLMKRKRNI